MVLIRNSNLISLIIFTVSLKSVYSISCYQCSGSNSSNPFECNEFLDTDNDLLPTDCSSIHDAQFCIKVVGRSGGLTIECFQCNSSTTMECGDGLINLDGGVIKPQPCDHVHNAQHCVKVIGGLSTQRYCSSLDFGNYCNYVQQRGDKLKYRTCIYTCNTDGCNGSTVALVSKPTVFFVLLSIIKALLV